MSPIRVIADTNIFYNLSTNKLTKNQFVKNTERLYATPISLLEIVSRIDDFNWRERRDAAQAILQYAELIGDDPERHLAAMFGRRLNQQSFDWNRACHDVARAQCVTQLRSGVRIDLADRLYREPYRIFTRKMIAVCDQVIPGYENAANAGKHAPKFPKAKRESFRKFLKNDYFFTNTLLVLSEKVPYITGCRPSISGMKHGFDALSPYAKIYAGYLLELLTTGRKPDKNDFGDLEIFKYLQPGGFVVTAEEKWQQIASHVGLEKMVRIVKH